MKKVVVVSGIASRHVCIACSLNLKMSASTELQSRVSAGAGFLRKCQNLRTSQTGSCAQGHHPSFARSTASLMQGSICSDERNDILIGRYLQGSSSMTFSQRLLRYPQRKSRIFFGQGSELTMTSILQAAVMTFSRSYKQLSRIVEILQAAVLMFVTILRMYLPIFVTRRR